MLAETFDCVEMKRKAQEALLDEFESMTEEEQLAYLKRVDQEIAELTKDIGKDPA
jgi:hypothetical protein